MNKVNTINFYEIKETSKAEKVIKSWTLTKEEFVDTNTNEVVNEESVKRRKNSQYNEIKTVNKVILTDKRLITTTIVENTSFTKNSYKLEDIKSVNCFIGQHIGPRTLNFVLGALLIIAGMACLTMGLSMVTKPTTMYIVGPVLMILGIVLLLFKKSEIGVTISIQVTPSKHFEIAESETSNKVDLSTKGQIKLTFEPCEEAVKMAQELDNLVIEAQSKLTNQNSIFI